MVYAQEDSGFQDGLDGDGPEEEDELLEGDRSDGGVRVSNAYIENNEDARGIEIERRNGLEPYGTLDKTIELQEGEIEILHAGSGKAQGRKIHPFALCARILPKLPCRRKKRTWSMCIRHLLGMNPGFCPGAIALRRDGSKDLFWDQEDQHKCSYCGLSVKLFYPRSYTQDRPAHQGLSCSFVLESHLPATTKNGIERRSCLICWEYEGIWAGAMDEEQWGKHMRRHFEEDGYWVCGSENNGSYMVDRDDCKARNCKAVHS